jgi:hypothetical protein
MNEWFSNEWMDENFKEWMNEWMNEFFSCSGEAVIEKRQKFNVFRHVQFEQRHMVVQVQSNDKNCWMGRFCPQVKKNVHPENALLTTTTPPPRCMYVPGHQSAGPTCRLLSCSIAARGITKKYAHNIYILPMWVQGLGLKHKFFGGQSCRNLDFGQSRDLSVQAILSK